MKGYYHAEQLAIQYPSIQQYEVKTPLEALRAVAVGKADAYVGDLGVSAYLIGVWGLTNLKVAAPTDLVEQPLGFGVRSDWPELAAILDKALASVSEEERTEITNKWISLADERPVDYSLVWKIGIVMGILIFLGFAWNFQIQRQKKALEKSERKFRRLVEGFRENIFFYARAHAGDFTYVSPSVTEVLGYTPEYFSANYGNSLTENPIDGQAQPRTVTAQKEPLPFSREVEVPHQNGSTRLLEISEIPSLDSSGNVSGVEGIAHDVTERRQAEEQVKAAKRSAEQATKSKSEFLANMSHEIRTPMNAILGFTELLKGLVQGKQQTEYISAIQSSGKSLLTLINDILDLSKVEAGKLELEYTAVNPKTVFEEMGIVFSKKISDKGLQFVTEIDSGLPESLILDEVRLRQVLLNLIGNAVKFTDAGHVKLSIRHGYEDDDRSELELVFAIEDTGIGIPQDQQELIFEAFEQEKGHMQARFGGTGLGLAITKRLVEMMGGRISVTSAPSKGSTFYVTLENVKVASVTELGPTREDTVDVDRVRFEHATIVVADDVAANRSLVRGYLEPYDLDLLEATDGEQAISLSRQSHPDLVLMDMKMPNVDGYEASRMIKEDQTTRAIPIIALTATAVKQRVSRIKRLCDGYLKKPVSRADLVAELMRFLKHTVDETAVRSVEPDHPDGVDSSLETHPPQSFDPETIRAFPELVALLERELEGWEMLRKTSAIDAIEEFAGRMQNAGTEFGYPPLVEWGRQLESQASSFQMDLLTSTLSRFPDLIDAIKASSPPRA